MNLKQYLKKMYIETSMIKSNIKSLQKNDTNIN